jgi:ADP-ribose pyrophosphatase
LTRDETLLAGKKFRVVRRTAGTGANSCHDYEVIVHPGAAVILPLLDDGRILLIHNHRVAVGQELLELPAGTLDDGEAPAACAARELAEETGYRVGSLRPLTSFFTSPGILTERIHAFLATELTPGATAHEAGEQIRPAPLTLAETLQAIRDGRICDAKTVLTLLYYERFVRSGESAT